MKKDTIIAIVITVAISLFVGYVSFAFGKGLTSVGVTQADHYEVKEYLLEREKRFHKALHEGLKRYMENDSVLWNNTFVKTEEYKRIKNLIGDECEEFNANEE